MSTAVKYYDSTMSGAPSLSGTAGALVGVLDACLVDGFGSVTVDSLTVASNVATATISGGHQFAMIGNTGPVITIAGANPSGRQDPVGEFTATLGMTQGESRTSIQRNTRPESHLKPLKPSPPAPVRAPTLEPGDASVPTSLQRPSEFHPTSIGFPNESGEMLCLAPSWPRLVARGFLDESHARLHRQSESVSSRPDKAGCSAHPKRNENTLEQKRILQPRMFRSRDRSLPNDGGKTLPGRRYT